MTKPLTGIQRVFLLDAATGLTAAESAQRLGVTEDNARNALKSARRKLGARNTAHAVYVALSLGLIEASEDRN